MHKQTVQSFFVQKQCEIGVRKVFLKKCEIGAGEEFSGKENYECVAVAINMFVIVFVKRKKFLIVGNQHHVSANKLQNAEDEVQQID